MSLADGEYEIDISELLDLSSIAPVSETENIAIRYGFVPDLMDQTQPLRLYQNEQECLLKANSTDGPEKPIIFEGLTQKHRGGDAYYLTYSPQEDSRVLMRRLNSTIRFSKSRNAQKLDTKLTQWEREARERQKLKPVNRVSSKRPPTANTTPEPKRDEPIISESDFDELNEFEIEERERKEIEIRERKEEQEDARNVERERKRARERERIHKEKELEMEKIYKERELIKERVKERETKRPTMEKSSNEIKLPAKPVQGEAKRDKIKKVVRKSKKSVPIIERVEGEPMDLDDDFKDLEDQLQEVLEEEEDEGDFKSPLDEPKSVLGHGNNQLDRFNDSDESDADEYQFSGIKINVDDGDSNIHKAHKHRYSDTFTASSSNSKPMSLRDLIGGGMTQDEDLSSSEEE